MTAALIHPMGISSRDSLTLTTRGRRVLVALAMLLSLGVVLFGGRAVAGAPAEAVRVDTYTVVAGESLWAIAAAYTAPHEDVRDVVGSLVALNGLAGAGLRAGQQILVPAG